MPRWKRWFITPYLVLLSVAAVAASVGLTQGRWFLGGWLFLSAPVAWVTVVHVVFPRRARTSRRYPSFVITGVAGWLLSWWDGSWWGGAVATLLLAGLFLYLYWYSEFGVKSAVLEEGAALPEFEAWEGVSAVTSASLRGRPALILFYRGNWCPVCTAQIQELARDYQRLAERGIQVVLVSPQPDRETQELSRRVGLPFRFWRDEGNRAAQKLGIVDPAGLPLGMETLGYGSDTPIPTALLVDGGGRIFYSDQAQNYRIRPEPRQYWEAFDAAERK